MRRKIMIGLVAGLVALMLVASGAMAAKLVCISKDRLKGEETVGTCLDRGEQFAIIDHEGIIHILTPQEVALMKKLNPKALEQKAFGVQFRNLAPEIPPLPVPMETQN
jgi:hypothetical protein